MAVHSTALGKPYSEHVLAAPGSEARSDLKHTSMQCLATEPGLQALCEHVLAAPGSEARSDLTHTSMQYLATGPGLPAMCELYLA